ncbi:MAG: helix-turn-helix domain-containing protein [Candidatus Cryptobacteroides sp.]
MILSGGQIFSWIALFIQIVSFVVCGTIRYFHMCPPYSDNEAYHYPSRKWVSFFFLLPLLEIPYLADPFAPDAWFMVKAFYLIYIPTLNSTLIRSYFLDVKKIARQSFLVIGVIGMACLSVIASIGDDILSQHINILNIGLLTFTLVMLIYLSATLNWLRKLIKAFVHGEYSDDESFPLLFAKSIFPVCVISTVMAIAVYFWDNPVVFGVFCLILTVMGVAFLIEILPPQRIGDNPVVSEIKENLSDIKLFESAEEVLKKDNALLSDESLDRLEMQVREYICEKQKFLNPKLNKTELARELGTNRTYLTTVFSERLGSFYSFVNKQRVEFARQYIKEHPKATQQEIALNSGFGSVKSYTRAKQTL